jgi:hypothetical protein
VEGILLQDWVNIRGQNDTVRVSQGADAWVDLGDFEDLAIFLDVRQVSTIAPKISYETAPSEQASAFLSMVPPFPAVIGQRVDWVYTNMAAVPPARFVRWTLQPGGVPWDITFRVWLAAYAWVKR